MKSIFSSKFVARDSHKILNQVVPSSDVLECAAFITIRKEVVVVIMNRGDDAITFKLLDLNNDNNQAVKITALPHSIQTFLYR